MIRKILIPRLIRTQRQKMLRLANLIIQLKQMRKVRRKWKLNRRKTLQSTRNKIKAFLILIKIMLRFKRTKTKTKRISLILRKKLHRRKQLNHNSQNNCNHFRSNYQLKLNRLKHYSLISKRLRQELRAH